MAGQLKSGIDYYSLDVNFLNNIKVRRIIRGCGASSVSILLYLLGNIYGDKGYYMRWNEDVTFLISDQVGVTEGLVSETVNKALSVDFFDKGLFEKYKILTSRGIQKRYLRATERRKDVCILSEYRLDEKLEKSSNVDNNRINVDNDRVNVCNDSKNVDNDRQSKVKESKVKESKVKRDRDIPPRHKYGEYKKVLLSDSDFEKLKKEFPSDYQDRIKRLDEYIAMKGDSYKNHLAVIRNWARRDKEREEHTSNNKQPPTKDWGLTDEFDI